MNGCIYKRNNLYYGVYYTGRVINGKREQKWTKGYKLKRDCKSELQRVICKIQDSPKLQGSMCSVGAYLSEWLENYSATKQLAKNTYNGYKVNIFNHIVPVIGDIRLDELAPEHLDLLFSELRKKGLSGTTQKYVYAVLRKALNTAVKRRLIPYNVVYYIDAPVKNMYEPVILNEKQLTEFKNAIDKLELRYSIPLYVLVFLGVRRGEMLGLKWSDFDFDNQTVHIQRSATPCKDGYAFSNCKTVQSRRFLKLPQNLVDKLLIWKSVQSEFDNCTDFVMCQENGKIICANTLNTHFKKLLKSCGLPDIRIHDIRHSWATLLAKNNVPIKITSSMLGHSDIQTTLNIYTHANIDMQDVAIDILNEKL